MPLLIKKHPETMTAQRNICAPPSKRQAPEPARAAPYGQPHTDRSHTGKLFQSPTAKASAYALYGLLS